VSDDDRPDQQPKAPAKVTSYTAGRVPGVSYRGGVAHGAAEQDVAAPGQPVRARDVDREPAGRTTRGRPAPAARPTGRSGPRRAGPARVLRWVGAIVVVLLAALVVLALLAWARIDKVAAIPDDHGSAVSEGRVYLLVGSDRFGGRPTHRHDHAAPRPDRWTIGSGQHPA
jgi:hypothetical protein